MKNLYLQSFSPPPDQALLEPACQKDHDLETNNRLKDNLEVNNYKGVEVHPHCAFHFDWYRCFNLVGYVNSNETNLYWGPGWCQLHVCHILAECIYIYIYYNDIDIDPIYIYILFNINTKAQTHNALPVRLSFLPGDRSWSIGATNTTPPSPSFFDESIGHNPTWGSMCTCHHVQYAYYDIHNVILMCMWLFIICYVMGLHLMQSWFDVPKKCLSFHSCVAGAAISQCWCSSDFWWCATDSHWTIWSYWDWGGVSS